MEASEFEKLATRRLRFSIEDEILMLQEVVALNPFHNKRKWREIHATLVAQTNKPFSERLVKEHTQHLVKLFVRNDRENLRRSGTEEECMVKEQRLQEVLELMRESRNHKKLSAQEEVNTINEAAAALEPEIRKMQQDFLQKETISYLQEQMRREQQLKERGLELEEERLRFEKEKFEYDKQERKMRLEMEMEERRAQLNVNLLTQKCLMEFMEHLKKK